MTIQQPEPFHSKSNYYRPEPARVLLLPNTRLRMIRFITESNAIAHKENKEINEDDVWGYIRKGEVIANQLADGPYQGRPTLDDARNFAWYLIAKAASLGEDTGVNDVGEAHSGVNDVGEAHSEGSFRIENPNVTDFLMRCRDPVTNKPKFYARASSHYQNKNLKTQQYGLDLKGLPFGCNTLLFGQLGDDKTTLVKIEYFGCPPFWERKFASLHNFLEFSKHSMDFFITRVRPRSSKFTARKEHVPQEYKEKFTKIMKQTAKKNKEKNRALSDEIKAGTQEGLGAMQTSLERHRNELDVEGKKMLKDLETQKEGDVRRGFTGSRQGCEVAFKLP